LVEICRAREVILVLEVLVVLGVVAGRSRSA